MLSWIVWNETVYLYKNGLGIKQPTILIRHKNPNSHLYKNGLGIKQPTNLDKP